MCSGMQGNIIHIDLNKKETHMSGDISVDDIRYMIPQLQDMLGHSEHVHTQVEEKVSELETIKDELETNNYQLGEALGALEGLAEIVDTIETLLNDADNEGFN